jgi:hypothetical protein
VTLSEGNSGNTPFTFTVSLSKPTSQSVTVDFATADNTATASGNDYQPTSGTLTFTAGGPLSKTITVTVKRDTTLENNESFFVNLTNATNASLADDQGAGIIIDDDPPPTVSFASTGQSASEAGGSFAVTVQLSAVSGLDVTIPFTATGTAVNGTDYTITASPITILAGQPSGSITITPINDVLVEPRETIAIVLGSPTGATLGANTTSGVTLKSDDGTSNQRYVAQAYQDLLLRPTDDAGLAFWSGALEHGTPRGAVAQSLTHSAEYYQTNVIKPAYRQFLSREADQAGLNFWTSQFQNGMTDEQMQAGFIASDEFYNNANGSAGPSSPARDRKWVDALYQVLLGRGARPGRRGFLDRPASRASDADRRGQWFHRQPGRPEPACPANL